MKHHFSYMLQRLCYHRTSLTNSKFEPSSQLKMLKIIDAELMIQVERL